MLKLPSTVFAAEINNFTKISKKIQKGFNEKYNKKRRKQYIFAFISVVIKARTFSFQTYTFRVFVNIAQKNICLHEKKICESQFSTGLNVTYNP